MSVFLQCFPRSRFGKRGFLFQCDGLHASFSVMKNHTESSARTGGHIFPGGPTPEGVSVLSVDGDTPAVGQAFIPSLENASFVEFDVFLPKTLGYVQFLRRISRLPDDYAHSGGFIVREVNHYGVQLFISVFFALLLGMLVVGEFFFPGSGNAGVPDFSGMTYGIAISIFFLVALLWSFVVSRRRWTKCILFTLDALLLCEKSGVVRREIPRNTIKAFVCNHGEMGIWRDRTPEWDFL